jgi:hypothetical protein
MQNAGLTQETSLMKLNESPGIASNDQASGSSTDGGCSEWRCATGGLLAGAVGEVPQAARPSMTATVAPMRRCSTRLIAGPALDGRRQELVSGTDFPRRARAAVTEENRKLRIDNHALISP